MRAQSAADQRRACGRRLRVDGLAQANESANKNKKRGQRP